MNHDPDPIHGGWIKNPDYDKAEGRIFCCERGEEIKVGPPPKVPLTFRAKLLLSPILNLPTLPQRIFARWLRRRGWVVFYLDAQYRHCGKECNQQDCWLALYQAEERRTKKHEP